MKLLRQNKLYIVTIALSFLFLGCRKSNDAIPAMSQGATDTLDATVSSPQQINIYPALVNNGNGPGRVFINTMQVGGVNVTIPMIFDTGSAGVTLNALSIFPNTIVDQNGFKFKDGQDTLHYNGIIVTKMNVKKVYGSAGNITTQKYGNIGYAKLRVGDASGAVKMLTMPILFYYQTLANGVSSPSSLGSIFGVNPTVNTSQGIQDSTFTFGQVSPLKYLVYQNNLTAGYKLGAVSLVGCEINTPGSCPSQPLLTVGLTPADAGAFQMNSLNTLNTNLVSPKGYPAYPSFTIYNPNIFNATVGTAYRYRTVAVLLDSGTPGMILNVSRDSLQVDNNPVITLNLPSKNTYSYNVNNTSFTTLFNRSSSRSVFGIYFFTRFNFLEDYQNGRIGLQAK